MVLVNESDLPSNRGIYDARDVTVTNTNSSYANGAVTPNDCQNQADGDELEISIENLSRFAIWKDVIAISLGFLFNFSAVWGLVNIESSLNSNTGLGSISLGIVSACTVISSFVLSTSIIIKFLKCKWTLVVCIFAYTLYISANFYASWCTLVPASILMGFAAPILWTVQSTYLTTLSKQYVRLSKETLEAVNSRFFGVFSLIVYFGNCIGNAISSLVLTPNENGSMDEQLHYYNICGKAYCNEDLQDISYNINETLNAAGASAESNPLTPTRVYTLVGIYTALAITSIIVITIFLRPLQGFRTSTTKVHGIQLLKAILRQLANPVQLAIMPLTIFSGLFTSFLTTDYNKAFTNCILGVDYIGYTVMCTAVFTATFSFLFGIMIKHVHRSVMYAIAALISMCLYVAELTWAPEPDAPWVFFVVSGLWGIAEAVWVIHLNAFYGILFPEDLDVSYSSYRLLESIGMMIGYLWGNALCMKIKLYFVLSLLILGMFGYIAVEIRLLKQHLFLTLLF